MRTVGPDDFAHALRAVGFPRRGADRVVRLSERGRTRWDSLPFGAAPPPPPGDKEEGRAGGVATERRQTGPRGPPGSAQRAPSSGLEAARSRNPAKRGMDGSGGHAGPRCDTPSGVSIAQERRRKAESRTLRRRKHQFMTNRIDVLYGVKVRDLGGNRHTTYNRRFLAEKAAPLRNISAKLTRSNPGSI